MAAAAPVVVDHEAVMGTALERIGLDTPGAWEEFVESTGFETLSDLLDMSDEDIKDSCYSYNKDEDNNFKCTMKVRRYLILLAFWVKERKHRGKPLVDPNDANRVHPHLTLDTLALYDVIKKNDEKRRKFIVKPEKIPVYTTDWDMWSDLFTGYCKNVPGDTGESLYYLLRPDKPVGWDPEDDAPDEDTKRLYQLLHTGNWYRDDVQKLWSVLVPAVRNNDTAWDTVRTHCVDESSPASGGDAHAAWLGLYNQHEGADARQYKETQALSVIAKGATLYSDETYRDEFINKTNKVTASFNTLERNPDRRMAEEDKVKVLIDMLSPIHNNHKLALDVHKVKTDYRKNYSGAVQYLTGRIAEEYGNINLPAQPPKSARRIREATRNNVVDYSYKTHGKTYDNVFSIPPREWHALGDNLRNDIIAERDRRAARGQAPSNYKSRRNNFNSRGRGGGRQFNQTRGGFGRGGRSFHGHRDYGRGNNHFGGRGGGRSSYGGRHGRGYNDRGSYRGRGADGTQYNSNDRSVSQAQRGDTTVSGLPNSISVSETAAAQSTVSRSNTSRGGRAGMGMGSGAHL